MKKLAVVVAASLLLVLTGCSASSHGTASSVAVPQLVGKGADVARDRLVDAGLLVKYDAGGASVWAASNWVVEDQSPRGGTTVQPGTIVTLKVQRKAESAHVLHPNGPAAGTT